MPRARKTNAQLAPGETLTVRLRKATRLLRAETRPVLPVEVKRCRMPRRVGADCTPLRRVDGSVHKFRLRIAHTAPRWLMLDWLCHEWAHVLDWSSDSDFAPEHSDSWGVWYSRCYRIVFDDEHSGGM